MEIKTDLNRKWKYLQFFRDDGFQGWSLGLSDEPSEVPCDKLYQLPKSTLPLNVTRLLVWSLTRSPQIRN